jgi:uncharacterized protein YraI
MKNGNKYHSPSMQIRALVFLSVLLGLGWLGNTSSVRAERLAQQPTVDIPTVTSSPSGAYAIVNSDQEQINVRSGPGTEYPIVGVLVAGQQVNVRGRSVGGSWVVIVYPGVPGGTAWVYAPLVTVYGNLPIVEPPPTPTPATTPTIDPTLAAQFIVEIPPTRLPTYTPPPPLAIPTFVEPTQESAMPVPVGFIISGVGVLGFFGLLLSLFRGR